MIGAERLSQARPLISIRQGRRTTSGPISVIIPTRSEGREPVELVDTLESIFEVGEVILVEAYGCRPSVVLEPEWRKVRVVEAPAGRARQLNRGAGEASCEVLLFLHADSRVDREGVREVARIFTRPGTGSLAAPDASSGTVSGEGVAASFRFGFREPEVRLRLLGGIGGWVSRWSRRAFGDSGLALRRDRFFELGGYPDVPIFEDWLIVRELRRTGRFLILDSVCRTSGRRFLEAGVLRQIWRNLRLFCRFQLGASLSALAQEYDGEARSR